MGSTTARKRGELVPLSRRIQGHRTGLLVGTDENGPRVDYPGNSHGPLLAQTTVRLPSVTADAPVGVLLVFEQERSDLPVVVGLLEPTNREAGPPDDAQRSPRSERVEALVDGQRLV